MRGAARDDRPAASPELVARRTEPGLVGRLFDYVPHRCLRRLHSHSATSIKNRSVYSFDYAGVTECKWCLHVSPQPGHARKATHQTTTVHTMFKRERGTVSHLSHASTDSVSICCSRDDQSKISRKGGKHPTLDVSRATDGDQVRQCACTGMLSRLHGRYR
jgi:hypothetical protein